MGVTLSSPYPTGWEQPKGQKGTVALRQAFAQPPPPTVGFGQSADDYPDESNRAPTDMNAGGLESAIPLDQWKKDPFTGRLLRPTAGPAFKSPAEMGNDIGSLIQKIQQAPQVQNLGQRVQDLGNALNPASGQSFPQRALGVAQSAWEVPTTAYRAAQDAGTVAGSGGQYPSFAESPSGKTPVLGGLEQYAPDIVSGVGGVTDLARGAAKVPGLVKQAGEAIANPRSLPGMVARAPLAMAMGAAGHDPGRAARQARQAAVGDVAAAQQAPGALENALEASTTLAKSKIRIPPAEELTKVLGSSPDAAKTLLSHVNEVLPELTGKQAAQMDKALNTADPALFKKQGVKGRVTQAALKVKTGDAEGVKQNVIEAADLVQQQRDAEKAQALQAAGRPPKPPKKPPKAGPPTPGPLPPEDATLLEHAPNLPQDLQDSVVSSVARGLTKGQKAAHAIGGASGFAYGYNQDQNDDTKTKIIKGLLYGGAGLEAAHVVSGGKLGGLPNRAMEMYRRQLLSPKTVIVPKIGQDVSSLIIAPITRGIAATLEHGPVSGIDEAIKNYGGYWASLGRGDFARSITKALNPTKALSADELASPGEAYGTIWTRLIQGVTQGVERMHESGAQWANSAALAHKENELYKNTTVEKSLDWLRSELKKDDGWIDAIEGEEPEVAEAIKSGLWNDPLVGAFAQEMHVNQQLADFAGTLPKAEQVAKDWTLTQPLGKGLKKGSPGQGGLVGRSASNLIQGLQDFPLLNPTIRGAQVPLGKMLFPFRTVVANAADQFINFIPLMGELNTRAYPEVRASTRIAKQVIGGATAAALLGVIGDGATDAGPEDKTKLYRWLDEGNMANSFRGPDGKWRPIKDLPAPLQVAFRTAGALNGYKRDKRGAEGPGQQAVDSLREFANAISDTSIYQSILDIGNLLNSTGTSAQREAGFMLGGLAGSNLAVPATAERPNTPDTSGTLLDNLKSRLPGIEKQVPDKLNLLGTAPVPNPDQGWSALLGSFAGKLPFHDSTADIYLDPKYGPGLASLRDKAFKPNGTNIPMTPDVQRAVAHATGTLLQQQTKALVDNPKFKAMDDAHKKSALSALQTWAHDTAYFSVVGPMRDKYVKSLPADKVSAFQAEELQHQVNTQAQKVPLATRSGKPLDPALATKYKEALVKYQDAKTKPPIYTEALHAKGYADAARMQMAMNSPDFPDYVQHKLLHLSDEDQKAFLGKTLPLIGKAGQYTPAEQLALYGWMRWYNTLPGGDAQKEALKPKYDHLHSQSNIKKIQEAESAAKVARQAEASAPA
jgi:hypothetical protein